MDDDGSGDPQRDEDAAQARRRQRAFLKHLIGYFAVMIVIVPVNLLAAPATPWFLLPMIGWGGVLAIHCAYVMGLFGRR